jgi:hypothetical protein
MSRATRRTTAIWSTETAVAFFKQNPLAAHPQPQVGRQFHLLKIRLLMAVLPKYAATAEQHLPQLLKMAPGGRFDKPRKDMIQAIEEAEGPAQAISFEEAAKAGR